MKEKICVLMTTYNPNNYIIEQVDSIMRQKKVEVEIVLRDDGSTHKKHLEKIRNNPKITFLEGENLGVEKNIIELMKYAYENKREYSYFAYSDQDDFWLEEKLISGISKLKKMDNTKPNLYYSNLSVSDENLQFSHYLFKKGIVKNTVSQSLAQVFTFACTCIFNMKMIDRMIHSKVSQIGVDSALYYNAIFFGNALYDDNSYILYRQHGNNVSGAKEKGLKYLFNKIKLFKKMERVFENNAKCLLKEWKNELDEEQKEKLLLVANYRQSIANKIKLLCNKEIRVGYYPKEFFRWIRIILNRY